MSPRRLRRWLVVVLVAAGAVAHAHEFWVEPDRFAFGVGQGTALRLFVGEAGDRREIGRQRSHLRRFEAIGDERRGAVVGEFGRAPAGWWDADGAGQVVVAYQGNPTYIEIPAAKFESYLEEESLNRAIAERVRRDESLTVGRESYARFAKAILVAGRGGPAVFDREVGLPLEIVARTDPETWQAGEPFVAEILYEGRPLADQPVKLIHLREKNLRLLARTDPNGRVRLHPLYGGRWLVATVFMRRAPAGVKGDWESFWGSLSFELAGPSGDDDG